MAVGAAIAGIALSVGGQISGGIEARKAGKKEQRLLNDQARLEKEAAEFDANQQARNFDELLGQQRLSFAASGVELVGSPLAILEQTQRDKQETIKNILETGRTRASALEAEGRERRKAGRRALTASLLGAGGSAASSVAKFKKG